MTSLDGSRSIGEAAVHSKLVITRVKILDEWFNVALHDPEQEKFWRNISTWESSTLSFVKRHTKTGLIFVDIGAWIGPITLLAARRGARVISVEPDPVAFSALQQNLLLNDLSADLICGALHTEEHGLTLYEGRNGFGDSMSSSLKYTIGKKITVPTLTTSHLLEKFTPSEHKIVLKVDIEGHEYVVGESIAKLRKTLLKSGVDSPLHLSLHPRLLRKSLRRKSHRFSRADVRRDTRRLLEVFLSFSESTSSFDGGFLCEDGVPLSVQDIMRRFVPSWPRVVRNFSVILEN